MTELRAGIYRHVKGGFYQVLGVARHHETGEHIVVYISLNDKRPGPRMQVRPVGGPDGFCIDVVVNSDGAPRLENGNTICWEEKYGSLHRCQRFEYVGNEVPT